MIECADMSRNVIFITIAGLLLTALFGTPLSSNAVTVGPVKLEYSVDPGQVIEGQMFLMNEEQKTQTFYPSFERFTEEDGVKVFLKENSDLSTWFSIASSITLSPGDKKDVPFSIKIPENASPGGHFAVMWWSTTPPDKNNQTVSIVTRAGVLVYLRVSGNVVEKGNIHSFYSGNRLILSFPVSFTTIFYNDGNVDLTPEGSVVISNVFGSERGTLPINSNGASILPQSSKSFNAEWDGSGFFFGPYKARVILKYGSSNLTAESYQWIFMFSWYAVLIIALLIVVIFAFPRLIKAYNRRVIEKYRQ